MNNGQLVVFSAPSGTGKSTICNALIQAHSNVEISISATTRAPRGTEKDGVEYFFLTKDVFEKKIAANEFLEYEQVHDQYYGTLKAPTLQAIKNGKTILFDIDVLGGLSIKKNYPDAILIYLKAPSLEELKIRLLKRKTETEAQIEKRLARVQFEEEKAQSFDHIIVNDDLNHTIKKIESIIFN